MSTFEVPMQRCCLTACIFICIITIKSNVQFQMELPLGDMDVFQIGKSRLFSKCIVQVKMTVSLQNNILAR